MLNSIQNELVVQKWSSEIHLRKKERKTTRKKKKIEKKEYMEGSIMMRSSSSSVYHHSVTQRLRDTSIVPACQLPLTLTNNMRIIRTPLLSVSAASSQFTLHPIMSELSLCVGAHVIPHPDKIERGGEDAFFTSSHSGGAIAVADGVSGWAEQNVDPALFSRELITNVSSMVDDIEVNDEPQVLLRKAHAATSSRGSATIIIAMMERNGILKVANVGDCGLRVIRKGQVMYSTCHQEHYFDCPYQLSSEATTQTYLDAVVSTVQLVEGDIVVMGSDGLFDNVYDRQLASTVISHSDVTEAAKALARLARDQSMDLSFDSPYSSEARSKGIDVPDWKKLLGMRLTGGKVDDITVVVATVVNLENSSLK